MPFRSPGHVSQDDLTHHSETVPSDPQKNAPSRQAETSVGGVARPLSQAASRRKVDKQSAEYIVKSGIAGGLAGCAVRMIRDTTS